ncbi:MULTISPECIES: phosphatase PAP2 family protein [unclassified Cytobacillus]|uniref:phosphatase PAP2 family protein n=1 Tax=unclassified Cytobacillus TaxID=2675268 RepID=UPI001359A21A|nr:phosphatase PAP2 family protein [Cytobacillus sp. AMY 15.2]KAF0816239.1 putative membrane-associated phospholipid phosphatase, PAP2 superfamily [Bacillus sp. ZZV12-4809]MCM3091108.1 phosphatase PAP2 family protein [Cytobacillus sp. AMY 15.2]
MELKNLTLKSIFYLALAAAVLGGFLLLFIEIVDELKENELTRFDESVIDYVQAFISPRITEYMSVVTFLGSVKWLAFSVLIASVGLFLFKKRSLAWFMVLSSGFGALFNLLLKWIFKRERPDIKPLIEEHGFSFPSGHSMGSFIFYGSLAYIIIHLAKRKRWKAAWTFMLCCFIIMIGLSRIYLGVHFPSDVIAGFAAGGAWLIIMIIGFRYYEYRKNI